MEKKKRDAALSIVRHLRDKGFAAYFADSVRALDALTQ
jgi:hypothetical protein